MPVSFDRLQFAPPPTPGMLRGLAFAMLAHLMLMLALTWGIQWKREPVTVSAQAELWSTVPREAAPKAVEPAVMVQPLPPAPLPAPTPPPPRAIAPRAPEPEPAPRQADIAVEREKEKAKLEVQAQRKQLALERARKREEQQELAARKRTELAAEKRAQADKELEAQRKLEARKKVETAKASVAADERQKAETAKRFRQADETKRLEAQREDNLKRMQGMANGTGGAEARGAAARAAGPSDSYAGRIRGRVKPNIVFGEQISGNPEAEVEVRTSPDGTIIGQRIVKSSGSRTWDEAVLKAVIKTEVLPRDVDGRVHSPLTLIFRPKD